MIMTFAATKKAPAYASNTVERKKQALSEQDEHYADIHRVPDDTIQA